MKTTNFKAILIVLSFITLFSQLQAQIKVACVGNSITEGWNGYPSFVPILQDLFGTSYNVQNFGVSGTTVLKNGDVPYWTWGHLPEAVAFQPDIIVIKLGTNDTKIQNWDLYGSEFKADYTDLVETLQASNQDAKVFLVLPVPIWDNSYGIRNSILQLQMPIVKEIAAEMGVNVIDANTPLLPFSDYFPDGVHPNSTGANEIAHLIYNGINSSGNAPTVAISVPANNAAYTKPASVLIEATASDSDGTVLKVEFYNGTTLLGEDTSSPYSFTWMNVNEGSYSISAAATDNDGNRTTSDQVLVSVAENGQDPNFQIYLCFGQSNMQGAGDIEQQDLTVDSRFQVLQAVDCPNTPQEEWRTATPPICRCYSELGPADYFGRTMIDNLPSEVKVGIVHVAVAGCKIELFDKYNFASYLEGEADWLKEIVAAYDNNPYARLVELAQLAQQEGVIKGILLHQGESNTGDTEWPTKVKGVYENLLADLGLNASEVPLLAGQLVDAEQGGLCASMNSIINTLPATITTAHIISSSECTDESDNLHFNSAGNRLLGQRYALKMLDLLGNTTIDLDNDGVIASIDCDDNDPDVGAATKWYTDADADGAGDPNTSIVACEQPIGYIAVAGDNCPTDASKTDPGACGCGVPEGTCTTEIVSVRATGTDGSEILELEINGTVVTSWTMSTSYQIFTYSGASEGVFRLNFTNDASGRDIQVDYLEVSGTTYQAEDQEVNTAAYLNGACGGGSLSEMMHCNGYIEFNVSGVCPDSDGDGTDDCTDNCPNDPSKVLPGECGCGVPEGTCSIISYTLTTDVVGSGTVSGGGTYTAGTSATVTATPASGYVFESWSGDASGTNTSVSITMDANKTVTATFVPDSDGDGKTCPNPTAISLAFTQNGVGEFCWFTSDAIAYVNSWNLNSLTINGADFTNTWSDNMPARIDGGYYIAYSGAYSWAHFEVSALKSAEPIAKGSHNEISVYPNPFDETIFVDLTGLDNISKLDILNSLGQTILTKSSNELSSGVMSFQLENAGNLFMIRVYANDQVYTNSILKK